MTALSVAALLGGLFYMILHVSGGQHFPPPLDKEEEAQLFRRARAGDMEARGKLIEHNLRLVAHIVKKYYTQYKNEEDLVSIGSIGLIKAIDTYRDENGARFTTYAGKCIQNEILMYFRSQKKNAAVVSMSEAIDIDKEGNPLTYADILSTEDHIAEDLFTKISSAKAIAFIMKHLDARERKVLILRYGLDGNEPVTQREIARRMGISRSYVSRIEKGALEKIAEHLRYHQQS